MRYKLTALTPLLVGDGQRLAPIDYMVWRDQVNVLDQNRIFRLLAKGPRLDNYLTQIKRAEKLDFASWGGFAQNYAGRRIPFEHPSSSGYWDKARAELLHIPTFSTGLSGPFLPGSALKGALRTGLVHTRLQASVLKDLAGRMQGDRPLRRPGETAELITAGNAAGDPMRLVQCGDSSPIPVSAFRVYLLRTATLESKQQGRFELGWKQPGRGAVPGNRPEDGSLAFAEMAQPGTTFEGEITERDYLRRPEIARATRMGENASLQAVIKAANEYSGDLLTLHRRYMAASGLGRVDESLASIESKVREFGDSGRGCVLNVGWGAGLLGKAAYLDTSNEDYRKILRAMPFYERAVRTGLPFPKTRRVVFLGNQPATLPGWVVLEVQ